MIKLFLIVIIVGANCFFIGYQYRGYKDDKFKIKHIKNLIKEQEERHAKRTLAK